MNEQAARNFHIDNIKGVLIFLVVVGHLLSYLQKMQLPFAIGVRTYIYFFHMPGFILLSGYLAKGFLQKQYKAEKLLSFAWLYLLFKDAIELVHFLSRQPALTKTPALWLPVALLFCGGICLLSLAYRRFRVFRIVFVVAVVLFSMLQTDVLTTGAAPWYLLALVSWYCCLYLTRNIQAKYVLTGAVLLSALFAYQDTIGNFLCLSRTLRFLPFFFFGYYIKKEQLNLSRSLCRYFPPLFFLCAAGILIPFGRVVQKYLGVFFFAVSPYARLANWLYPIAPLVCVLWMAVVLLMLLGLIQLCSKRETFLCRFGRNSLGIYILHRLFKDFLIYSGCYDLLSQNEYLAVLQVLVISLLLCFLFGNAFWTKTLTSLSRLNIRPFYRT